MRVLIFPRGLTYFAPADRLGRKVADLVTSADRRRAIGCASTSTAALEPGNPLGLLQEALHAGRAGRAAREAHPRRGRQDRARHRAGPAGAHPAGAGRRDLSQTEAAALRDYDRKVMDLIHVDDFDPQALGTQSQPAPRASAHVA